MEVRSLDFRFRTETVAHDLDHFGVAFSLVLSLTIAIKAIVVAITTLALLLFLAGAIVRKHAEIMVGELEVIFRIDTITLRLRVTCQVLVLFKKLGTVDARQVIDAIT